MIGVSSSLQLGMSSSIALVSNTFPLKTCAPTSDAFSRMQIDSSSLSCLSLIADERPAGPAPTITTSYNISSLCISDIFYKDNILNITNLFD